MQDKGKTYEIAMLGDQSSIAGFRGVGVRTFAVNPDSDVNRLLEDLIFSEDFAIIYITEAVATEVAELLAEHKDDYLPAIITLPTQGSEETTSVDNLRSLVIRAIGVDLVSSMLEDDAEEQEFDEDEYMD